MQRNMMISVLLFLWILFQGSSVFGAVCVSIDYENEVVYGDISLPNHPNHVAFPDLILYDGYFYMSYREASGHNGNDGVVKILRSNDTVNWTAWAEIDQVSDGNSLGTGPFVDAGSSLRIVLDIKEVSTGNRIPALGTINTSISGQSVSVAKMSFSGLGSSVSTTVRIIWDVRKTNSTYYATMYAEDSDAGVFHSVHLLSSTDLINWTAEREDFVIHGNEIDFVVDGNDIEAMGRGFGADARGATYDVNTSVFGGQRYFYTEDTNNIESPCIFSYSGNEYVIARKMWNDGTQATTSIGLIDWINKTVNWFADFPRGSDSVGLIDNGYPGVAPIDLANGEFLVAYYSPDTDTTGADIAIWTAELTIRDGGNADMDGNCKTDFVDYASFAEEWQKKYNLTTP